MAGCSCRRLHGCLYRDYQALPILYAGVEALGRKFGGKHVGKKRLLEERN